MKNLFVALLVVLSLSLCVTVTFTSANCGRIPDGFVLGWPAQTAFQVYRIRFNDEPKWISRAKLYSGKGPGLNFERPVRKMVFEDGKLKYYCKVLTLPESLNSDANYNRQVASFKALVKNAKRDGWVKVSSIEGKTVFKCNQKSGMRYAIILIAQWQHLDLYQEWYQGDKNSIQSERVFVPPDIRQDIKQRKKREALTKKLNEENEVRRIETEKRAKDSQDDQIRRDKKRKASGGLESKYF
jgi:hypothetical protein